MAKLVTLLVAVALVLPATALAATVSVRVEGKTKNLYAPTEVAVTASNALDALEQASILGELDYHVIVTGTGPLCRPGRPLRRVGIETGTPARARSSAVAGAR